MAYKEVEWLFQRDVEETYNITVGGEVITTTDEHPFWIVGKGWVEAQYLALGDVLTTSDGRELAIARIEVKQEHTTVYNFKVKDFHTYFVSNLGIWTHNKCGDLFQRFDDHYDKHVLGKNGGKREYGDDFTKHDYYNTAMDLVTSKADGVDVFTKTRASDGATLFYRKSTNDFSVLHKNGEIGSLFKPSAGKSYFDKQ
jgi:hypothetical protein